MFKAYIKLISNTSPSKSWQVVRSVLHWLTIPIKLILIGLLGIFGIIYNRLAYKKRQPELRDMSLKQKQDRLKRIIKSLPVVQNDQFDLYLPRNKMTDVLNGGNHNSDHQCLRQGLYVMLMSKLGKRTFQMDNALTQFISDGRFLLRGYKFDYATQKFVNNAQSTSGDMLLGLCLGMLDTDLTNSSQDFLIESYDQLISSIIDNDYSLIEMERPKDAPYNEIYDEELKRLQNRKEDVRIKSSRGMWQPGLETVGAQALTILAALKVGAKKVKNREAEKEYWKLFYKQGYALLSLLPTAYLSHRRGYFNDSNCINALYVLLKLADTRVEKFVYKFALRYVFNLSKSWYNPYFTGLVKEVAPGLVGDKYLKEVREYLYEEDPAIYTMDNAVAIKTKLVPVPLSLLNSSEFPYESKQDNYITIGTGTPVRTGLGNLAAMVLLEEDLDKIK